jgi:hypothetical protein
VTTLAFSCFISDSVNLPILSPCRLYEEGEETWLARVLWAGEGCVEEIHVKGISRDVKVKGVT